MNSDKQAIDKSDKTILDILQQDCRVPLHQIARKVRIPASTVHYRIRKLERAGILDGYYAKLNPTNLGFDYLGVVQVKARYGLGYRAHQTIGRMIAKLPGVWAVYYLLGEIDFVVMIRAKGRKDYLLKLARVMEVPKVERTSTQVVAEVMKEDHRVELT